MRWCPGEERKTLFWEVRAAAMGVPTGCGQCAGDTARDCPFSRAAPRQRPAARPRKGPTPLVLGSKATQVPKKALFLVSPPRLHAPHPAPRRPRASCKGRSVLPAGPAIVTHRSRGRRRQWRRRQTLLTAATTATQLQRRTRGGLTLADRTQRTGRKRARGKGQTVGDRPDGRSRREGRK